MKGRQGRRKAGERKCAVLECIRPLQDPPRLSGCVQENAERTLLIPRASKLQLLRIRPSENSL